MLKVDYEQCLHNISKENYLRIFADYKIQKFLLSLKMRSENRVYSYKLKDLHDIFHEVSIEYEDSVSNEIRKIVLLKCLVDNWDDIFSIKHSVTIQKQYKRNFKRFLDLCNSDQGWGKYTEDVYWKDLAIACQQMFPAGAQIVEKYSGIAWRQGLSFDLLQSAQFLSFLLKAGGKDGYYQIHTHTPELSEFNEQGWNKCYGRISDMLKSNKEIKGMFGGSWFYDPQLENISPRLMYLQKIPLSGGARIFHIGEDKTGNALAKSKTRVDFYNKGDYIPQSYLLVWLRNDIINWADRAKEIFK